MLKILLKICKMKLKGIPLHPTILSLIVLTKIIIAKPLNLGFRTLNKSYRHFKWQI